MPSKQMEAEWLREREIKEGTIFMPAGGWVLLIKKWNYLIWKSYLGRECLFPAPGKSSSLLLWCNLFPF
jgi:hypothetical protein